LGRRLVRMLCSEFLRREEGSMEKARMQAGSWNGAVSLEFGGRRKPGGPAIVVLIPMGIFTCG
jgi:hypothetical protein